MLRSAVFGVTATTGFNSGEDGGAYTTGDINGQGSAVNDWAGGWTAAISATDPTFAFNVAAGGSQGGGSDQSLAMEGSVSSGHNLTRAMDPWSGDFEWSFDVKMSSTTLGATCQQQLEGGTGGVGTLRPLNIKWENGGNFKVNDVVLMSNYGTPTAGYVSMTGGEWVSVKVVCTNWATVPTFDLYWEKLDGTLGWVGAVNAWKDAWLTSYQVGTFKINAPKNANMWVDNIRLAVPGPAQPPEITSCTLTNGVLRVTFAGGELESAWVITGPWTGTGNSSGEHLESVAGGTNKFYRVRSGSVVTPPGAASNPSPADDATGVSTTTGLSWTAGSGASSHDVYLGTSNPPGFQGNQAGTTYNPGILSASTTYHWRIDEKNSGGTTTGTVWSFTTGTNASLTVTSLSPATNTVQYNSLAVGQLIYTDRVYTFTDVATLGGATYIRTANNDKYATGSSYMTFTVNQNVVVYVAHDDVVTTKPSWLSTFTDTGANLAASNPGTYSLYAKEFGAGTVTLGGNEGGVSSSMYSVVITPAPTSPPTAASNPSPANGAINISVSAGLSWAAGGESAAVAGEPDGDHLQSGGDDHKHDLLLAD